MSLDLSVIVCTYNRVDLLRHTLAALAAQRVSSSVRWDIVVGDNNSTDDTRLLIPNFARTAPVSTRYLFEGCQGLSYARNAGIAASEGAIVAFTDDDVMPDADWVQRVVSIGVQGVDGMGGRVLP